MLMFGWDWVDAESRFWRWNSFKICVWTCNITLARWTQPLGPLCLWQCFNAILMSKAQLRWVKISVQNETKSAPHHTTHIYIYVCTAESFLVNWSWAFITRGFVRFWLLTHQIFAKYISIGRIAKTHQSFLYQQEKSLDFGLREVAYFYYICMYM